MTSKHLYFKLLWEDIKQKLWAAALLALAMFFGLPDGAAMSLPGYQPNDVLSMAEVIQERTNNLRGWLEFGERYPLMMMVLFCTAVVMGISCFSYLHNKKQVDFYHSLPVKRSLWFWVHITTGILLPAVIYFAAIVITLIIGAANGVFPGKVLGAALVSYILHMLYYVLVYMTVVLAMMMTGTKIAAVLGSVVFFSYFPAVSSMIAGFSSTFLESYYYYTPTIWNRVLIKLSPVHAILLAENLGVTPVRGICVFLVSVILGIGSYLLYRKRPSEAAGKTMAFVRSKGIIKVLLVVAFGMAGAMFFYAMGENLGWTVFGVVVGVVISHCVIEVIYYSDFKKLFCHEKTMAVCMAASLLIVLSFYFDWFRYDSYVPRESQVSYASVDFGKDRWVAYSLDDAYEPITGSEYLIERAKVTDMTSVFAIAREGIRQIEMEKNERDALWADCDIRSGIVVAYTLKNGKKVYRSYDMFIDPVFAEADAVYLDPEYKKALYPALSLPAEDAAEHLAYRDNNRQGIQLPEGTPQQWKAVVEAYQEEMTALSFSRRREENPLGELFLMSGEDINKAESRFYNQYDGAPGIHYTWGRYDGYYYPVYPSFTKTIQALKDCDIEVGLYTAENLVRIQITAYGPFDESDADSYKYNEESGPYMLIYTEPEQMQEILDAYVSDSVSWKNGMVISNGRYEVELIFKSPKFNNTGGFKYKKIPEFVIEDFRKADAK